jgi:hypothetical protein
MQRKRGERNKLIYESRQKEGKGKLRKKKEE